MNFDCRNNINETKNQDNIFKGQIFPSNNDIIKDNYIILIQMLEKYLLLKLKK